MPLTQPTRHSSASSLSPTPATRKATAMHRKRPRDWCDAVDQEDADRMGRGTRHFPSPPHLRPRPAPAASSWSCASKRTDRSVYDVEAPRPSEPSLYREIQAGVNQVGVQIAQAQRDVAELRALLRVALATKQAPRPRGRKTVAASTARVRIDRLCS